MQKSKFFIAAGALVLAVSAFTTNTTKKFAGTLSAYFQTTGGWNTEFKALNSVNDAPRLTTIKHSAANKTAFFRTTGGNYRLYKIKSAATGNTLFTK